MQYLNQNIIKLIHMTAIIKGLFRWSLEITGVSIIWYNYQTYERQQKILGIYGSLKNSYRFSKCLYGLSQDLNAYTHNINNESLAVFRANSAKRLAKVCGQNLGAYARIAQVLGGYTDIMPQQYTSEFKKLSEVALEGASYSDIKSALTSIFQKDTKDVFDGFQTKPLKVGLLTQTHKAVLLENYREVVVKVLLPSTKVQADHDIWFINKVKDYMVDYLTKNNFNMNSYKIFLDALNQAQSVVNSEVNFEKQLQNIEKNKPLMYESNSSFYVPYYFSKLCNKNIIIRQFIEGVTLNDLKGLKELGLNPEVAYAYVLSEVHHLMKRLHVISGSLNPKSIMLRKYIKPYKPPAMDSEIEREEARDAKKKAKPTPFIHPQYQVVFLAQNNFQQIPAEVTEDITTFWNNLKKEKKKILPSVASFYQRLPKYQQLKENSSVLMAQRYYLYEPLLKMYETLLKKE